jgi:hypothetical protein
LHNTKDWCQEHQGNFVCLTNTTWQKRKALESIPSDLRHIVVADTGQSSQLFPITTGRNAQFLATAKRSRLVQQVEADETVSK